jgi:hypothetical protein
MTLQSILAVTILTIAIVAPSAAAAEVKCLADCIRICNQNRPDLSDTQCHIRFCTKFDGGCLCDGAPCGKNRRK